MIYSAASFAAVIVVLVGGLILWANPRRRVNQAVSASSAIVAAWLLCLHLTGLSSHGLFWLRWSCAVGGFAPLGLWLVKESMSDALDIGTYRWMLRNIAWFAGPVFFAILPFSDAFIPSYSTDVNRLIGWGYYVYYAGLVVMYAWLLYQAVKSMKHLTGLRKLELQVVLLGGCVLAVSIYGVIGVSFLTGDPFYRELKPLGVLLFYIGTAYAITTHRIFNARQILLVGFEKLVLMGCVAIGTIATNRLVSSVLSQNWSLIVTTLAMVALASVLSGWLDQRFKFLPKAGAARQAAFAAAQRETRLENLEMSFGALLKSWGQTEQAVIIAGTRGVLSGSGISLPADNIVVETMKHLRWATPERLARERSTPGRAAVADFLALHGLGVLVFEEGAALTVLVGVAIGASRRPFTYPYVSELMELASIIQGALERAHFSTKVQQTEQLATVGLLGASLAHEIRNPLVSIKTFVQLLPTHHQDPRFREKFFRLIGDEVGRIDQLTEQLLDLASPRAYTAQPVELHPLLQASLELVAAKASHKNVRFVTELRAVPDSAYTDASAAKQVLLNLCFNAIQAVETKGGEDRWVKIATRNVPGAIEMAVADSGPGISDDIRPRLFQPFQTTKSTGFGLGLAICSDILANLNATISVDPPAPGQGATFRVTFPCQPLSS